MRTFANSAKSECFARCSRKLCFMVAILAVYVFLPARIFAQVTNDECVTATTVGTLPFMDQVNTRLATVGVNDPALSCADGGGGKTVWYIFTATRDTVISVNTRGSSPEGYDTAIAIFTGACDTLVELRCNDDIVSGTERQSEIIFEAQAGETYIIHIAEWNGGGPSGGVPTGGDLVFNVEETTLPPFYQGPATGNIAGGASISTNDFPATPVSQTSSLAREQRSIPFREIEIPETGIKKHLIQPTGPEGSNFVRDLAAAPEEINAPVLQTNFPGIPDLGAVIPPDPHMAAGPTHLMATVNSQFAVFSKTGTMLKLINADDWFANVHPGGSLCDPQIVFDHHSGRWIMIWIECGFGPLSLLVSVSDDDNPLGTWCNWRLPGDQNGSTPNGLANDYPKLGVDAEAIYITSNMFGASFEYVHLRVIPKAQLHGNSCGPVTWTDFWDLRNPSSPNERVFTTVPAVTFGTPGAEYLVDVDFLNTVGTFMNLWSLTDPLSSTPTLTAASVPVAAFSSPLNANQLGGGAPRIDVGGRRNRNVVYQNGSVWTAHSIADPSGEFARARYVRIDVNTASAIEDVAFGEDNFWYYYPAIHPDGTGNMIMAFTRSGENEYASARYTGRRVIDPPGLLPSALLKAGEDNYVKTFGGARNRWGDYMGIAMDPADTSKVWMFVEYAEEAVAQGFDDDRWGTWFGSATFNPLAGPQILVDPPSITFGTVEIGKSSPLFPMSISNQGDSTLTITAITASSGDFVLTDLPTLPVELGSFAFASFNVSFAPTVVDSVTGTITIVSNDPDNPMVEVSLSGNGLFITPAEFGVLYASTGRADQGRLLTIDTATGAGTLVGSTGLAAIPGLAINTQGEVFGADQLTGDLYRIDAATGQSGFAASTGLFALQALAFDANGVLYGVDFSQSDFNSRLYTINTASGATTLIGIAGDFFTGIAFDPTDGTLWGSTGGAGGPNIADAIYTIDPTTGEATFVGTTGLGGPTPDIQFDADGNMYGVKGGGLNENRLIAIDKTTGAGTVIGPIGFASVSGMASRFGTLEGRHISAIPLAVNFGKVLIGDTSAQRTVTIRSIGTDTLTVTDIALSNPAAPFVLSALPALPAILPPRASVTFRVAFAPSSTGLANARIIIRSDDVDDSTKSVLLRGDGRDPAPPGSALFFVDGADSTISQVDPIIGTVLNTITAPDEFPGGPAGLAYDGISLFYVNRFGSNVIFEIDPLNGEVLNSFPSPPGGFFDALAHSGISLFGLSASTGAIFEMDPSTGEVRNRIAPPFFLAGGMSYAGTRGTLFVTEGFFFFSNVHEVNASTGEIVNSFSSPRPNLQGLGYSEQLGMLFAGTQNGKIFALNPNNGQLLDSLIVAGAPAALAADEFIILEGSNLALSPTSINFGKTPIGRTSAARKVTIKSIGTQEVTVTNISISESGALFILNNVPQLPAVIPPRRTVTFEVTFTPQAPEVVNAALIITSNDVTDSTRELSLRGEGVEPPPPGTLFASTGQFNNLITINPQTGGGTFIGSTEGLGPVAEIEFRNDGALFATTERSPASLITIDIFTGTPKLVANLGFFGLMNGLEFDEDGRLYGALTQFFGGNSELVTIDTETGAVTSIGNIGFQNVGGLAFALDGTLYGVTSRFDRDGELITIDLRSGRGTLVGPTGFNDFAALEFAPDGALYGGLGGQNFNTSGSIIIINPETGAGTFLGLSGFTIISGLSFFPAGPDVQFSIPDNLAKGAGGIVDVPISLKHGSRRVSALGAAIKAGNGILSFTGFTPGPIVPGAAFNVNAPTPDSILVAFADFGGGPIIQDGLLATLHFQVDANALQGSISLLTFSELSAVDSAGNSFVVVGDNGTFTVVPVVSVSGNVTYCSPTGGGDVSKPVGGLAAELSQSGSLVHSAATDTAGNYLLAEVNAGINYLLAMRRESGGINAAINPTDAVMALNAFLGALTLTGCQNLAGDVDGNLKIEPADALLIFNRFLGTIPEFPVEAWRGYPASYDIDLTPDAWMAAPESINYPRLDTEQTGQDFFAVVRGDVNLDWTAEQSSSSALAKAGSLTNPRPAARIQFSVNSGRITAGASTVTWTTNLSGHGLQQGLYAFGGELHYDASSLEIIRVTWGEAAPSEGYQLGYNIFSDESRATEAKEVAANALHGRLRFGGFSTSTMAIRQTGVLVKIEARLKNALAAGAALPIQMKNISAALAAPAAISMSNDAGKRRFESAEIVAADGAIQIVDLPTEFALEINYPNPFNPNTMIRYQLPEAAAVKLTIFNTLGQRVRVLVNTEAQAAGFYDVAWDSRNDAGAAVASGVYFYRIETTSASGRFTKTRRMMLAK